MPTCLPRRKSSIKTGDPIILRRKITIPDGDELIGEETVVVKVKGYGAPIEVRIISNFIKGR